MELSLVITTYNRRDVLADLLAHLEGQTDKDFEVVVAIDGSTDGTAEMLAGLGPSFPLTWVDTGCTGYGLAVARNRGILAAKGRAVAILDDDSFPAPGFVAAHKAGVAAGVITGGPRWPSDPGAAPKMQWKAEELCKLPPLTPMSLPQLRRDWPNAWLIENNICLLRRDWVEMGLFSERLKLYGFIGQEFFARAEHLGLKYQFNPAAAVTHHGEFEGDNALSRARKTRQTRRAELIRPALMTPRHYAAQAAWAGALEAGQTPPALPPFALAAAAALPYRAARRALRPLRRALRGRI